MISFNLRSVKTPLFGAISLFGVLVFGVVHFAMTPVAQGDTDFARWVGKVWPTARAKGISRKTFDQAFAGVVPNPQVLISANHQPEFVKPVWEYLEQAL